MNDQHYAVVVGIDRYAELRNLNAARQDAEAFAGWLKSPEGGGLPDANVALITIPDQQMPDGTPRRKAKPTKERVFDALDDFREECERHFEEHPEDWTRTRLYLYVAGHGIARSTEEGTRDAALLMANAGRRCLGENVSCAKLLSFFETAEFFHELVVFADCCRGHAGGAPICGPTWTEVNVRKGGVVTVVGYACQFGDKAFEGDPEDDPDDRRGYFTKALLEGLRGAAVNDNNDVDSTSLAEYVHPRVMRTSGERRSPQRPHFMNPQPPIVFRRNVPAWESKEAKTHRVTINFVTEFRGPVAMLDGEFEKLGERDGTETPWILPLENGLYKVGPADESLGNPFKGGGLFQVFGEDTNVKL